jgi:hypothetical protein
MFFCILKEVMKFLCDIDEEHDPVQLTEHDSPLRVQPEGMTSERLYCPTFSVKLPVEPAPLTVVMLGDSEVGPLTLKLNVPLAVPDFFLMTSVPVSIRVLVIVQALLSPGAKLIVPSEAQSPPMTES